MFCFKAFLGPLLNTSSRLREYTVPWAAVPVYSSKRTAI